MHPILFTFPESFPLLGGRSIHVYGFMIAVGFLVGMQLIKRASEREGLDSERVLDVFFYGVVAGLVGSRVLYVLHSVTDFWTDPLVFFRVWEGGLVFQGGIIGAVAVIWWLCKKFQLSFAKVVDVFAPALALGHALGRVGCFFAGCCHGRQCSPDFFLAVVFPEVEQGIAPPGVPLYPTQLFEAFGEVLLFVLLIRFAKQKPFDGAVFLLYLMLYSVLRSVLEIYRGDLIRGFVFEGYVSNAQFISLVTIVASALLWRHLQKKKEST